MMPEKKENQTKKKKKKFTTSLFNHGMGCQIIKCKHTHTHTIHTKREIFGNKSLLNGND